MPGPSNPEKPSKSKGKRRAVIVRSSEEPLEAPPVIAAPPVGSTSQLQPPPPYRMRGSTRGRPLRTLELVEDLEEEFESLLPYLDPEAELPEDDDLHTRLLLKIATVAPLLVRLFSLSVTRYLQLSQNRAHNHIDTCLNADIAAACEHVSYLLYRIDPAQYISVWGRPSWSWVKDTIPDEPFAGFQVAGGPVLVDTPIPQLVPLEEDPELPEDDEAAERPSLAGAVPPCKSFSLCPERTVAHAFDLTAGSSSRSSR